MRPGLVVLGGLVSVLGVAVVGAYYLYPGPTDQVVERPGSPVPVPAGGATNLTIVGTTGNSPQFSLRWSASLAVSVRLYVASQCPAPPTCAGATPLAAWTDELQGSWTHSGALGFPLNLVVQASANGSARLDYVATTTVSTSPSSTGLTALLIDLAAGVLLTIGGLAVFLGLFLRGNPYGPPRALVSRTADDAEAIAGLPGPPRRP